MPTLTTYFLNAQSTNQTFTYPAGINNVSPTTNNPGGNLWSWIPFTPSRIAPNTTPLTPSTVAIQTNDTSYLSYDQDSATYNPPASNWILPTTAGLDTYTDTLTLYNIAVKPNLSWTIKIGRAHV